MVISVFHLPNMGGEKITLSISVLLALTFFLNLVSGLTPRNGFLIVLARFNLHLEVFGEDSHVLTKSITYESCVSSWYEMHGTQVHKTRLVQ